MGNGGQWFCQILDPGLAVLTTDDDLLLYYRAYDYDSDVYSVEKEKTFLSDVKTVESFDWATIVLTNTNSLYIWGKNSSGIVGNGTMTDVQTPYKVLDNVEMLSYLDYSSIIAKTSSGAVYGWGLLSEYGYVKSPMDMSNDIMKKISDAAPTAAPSPTPGVEFRKKDEFGPQKQLSPSTVTLGNNKAGKVEGPTAKLFPDNFLTGLMI